VAGVVFCVSVVVQLAICALWITWGPKSPVFGAYLVPGLYVVIFAWELLGLTVNDPWILLLVCIEGAIAASVLYGLIIAGVAGAFSYFRARRDYCEADTSNPLLLKTLKKSSRGSPTIAADSKCNIRSSTPPL
jgi:hypothetical protein